MALRSMQTAQTAMKRLTDWDDWHRQYEVLPSLQARLRIVREQICAALDEFPPGRVRVVSICAGDGRDLIGALQEHPRREDVEASLLDNNLESINRGKNLAADAGLGGQIRFIHADASLASNYSGQVPADLVILSGFLGHLPHDSVPRLIESLPMICKTGGSAIWNRHLVLNEGQQQVPRIRELLTQNHFSEVQYETTSADGFAVGRVRFTGKTVPLEPARIMFRFVGLDKLTESGAPTESDAASLPSIQLLPEPAAPLPAPFDVEQSILARFEQVAALFPSRQAIGSGDWQPDFSELNRVSNRLAHALLARSANPGDRVALLMRHDTPLVAAMLAVLKAGKAVVVLNPSEPPARLSQLLDDSQPVSVVTDVTNESLAGEVAGASRHIVSFNQRFNGPDHNPGVSVDPSAMAFLVYTSGSTGRPKGVIQTHRNILHNVLRHTRGMRLSADDRVVLLGSPSGGQGMAMTWTALLNGAALCPFPAAERGVTGLGEWLAAHGITIFVASVSLLRNFLRGLKNGSHFPRVRLVRFASEASSSDDLLACRARFGDRCVVLNTFSSSETGNITQCRIEADQPVAVGRVGIGTAAPGMEVMLWDDEGREIRNDAVGEIVVKSRFLSPGYWGDDALTSQRFLGGPDGTRLYKTGDLARRGADGTLMFMGRKDDRIKINGYRVELRAIEDALLKQPEVAETVVCARDAANGQQQLVAYLVLRHGRSSSPDALRQALRGVLPGYMVPARFIFLEQFPLTPHGKVDRQALPVPQKAEITRAERPREATEKSLTSIWQTVLGIPEIGRDEDFFEIGGSSLQAVEVLLHIEEKLGAVLPPSALAEYSTIAKLAPLLANHVIIPSPSPLVVLRNGSGRPLFLLHTGQGDVTSYGHLARRLPGRAIYGLQSVGLQGESWPLTSVKAMARRYLPEIIAKDPTGPYLIAGTCMGGMVAFELAHMLREQGSEIGLLALFDVPHPPTGRLNRGWRKNTYDLIREEPRDWLRMLRWSVLRAVGLGRSASALRGYRRFVGHMNGHANRHYKPRFYSGEVTLFLTADQKYECGEDLRLEMRRHIKEVRLIHLPGRRRVLFNQPIVDELAAKLNECLP